MCVSPMPTWPLSLPQQLLQRGYRESLADNVIRTSVDAGPEKRRPRFTAAVKPLSGSMTMTSAQLDTLEIFVDDDIASGALAFDFPAPRDQATMLSVALKQPPGWTNLGGDNYEVNLEMEIPTLQGEKTMPLFTTELNRLADSIGASTLTIRLHTAAPTDASPTNGRVTAGGGVYLRPAKRWLLAASRPLPTETSQTTLTSNMGPPPKRPGR